MPQRTLGCFTGRRAEFTGGIPLIYHHITVLPGEQGTYDIRYGQRGDGGDDADQNENSEVTR
jgi:hypothetical protein